MTSKSAQSEAPNLLDRKKILREAWQASRKQKAVYIVGLAVLLFFLLLVGLSNGGASFNVAESWDALLSGITLGKEEMDVSQRIIWQLRVPRVLMAIAGGMGLAVAGLVMQTILRNPLASPYTLGISSAASFGAAIAIVTGLSANSFMSGLIPANYIIAFNAFLCAAVCTFVVYGLSKTQQVTAETIVLFGVAMNFSTIFTGSGSSLKVL